jgi:hypothetical protein
MVWERFYQIDYPNKITGFALYTKQFSLIIGDFQTIIVKPSEFKFLLLDNNVFGYAPNNHVDSINSDNLFFRAISSSREMFQYYKINLNTTWKKHAGKIKSFNLKPIEKVNPQGFNSWFVVSLVLLITIIFGYFVMKRSQARPITALMDAIQPEMIIETPIQNQTAGPSETFAETIPDDQTEIEDETQVVIGEEIQTDIEENLSDSLYRVLLQSEKTFFSGDELDEIFGIAHLEPDSKKSKRHRYLANLDKNHPGFVVRIKEQIDKRRFNYKIVK